MRLLSDLTRKIWSRSGAIHNSLAAGVIEPAMSKCKSISFATEAAITILRIDDMIKIKKPEERG
jgi:T-complex protein 1 subunit alpha